MKGLSVKSYSRLVIIGMYQNRQLPNPYCMAINLDSLQPSSMVHKQTLPRLACSHLPIIYSLTASSKNTTLAGKVSFSKYRGINALDASSPDVVFRSELISL